MAKTTKPMRGNSQKKAKMSSSLSFRRLLASSPPPEDADARAPQSPPVAVTYIRPPTPASEIPDQFAEEWGPTKHRGKLYQLARFSPHCRACDLFQKFHARCIIAVDEIANEAKHSRSSRLELPSFIRHRWTSDDAATFKFFHRVQISMDVALREGFEKKDFTEYRELERTLANFKEDQLNKKIVAVLSGEGNRWVRREKWERVKAMVREGVEVVAAAFKRGGEEERVVIREE